jgi:hypothetical protein
MTNSKKVLAGIPNGLREPLLKSYKEISSNYIERRWKATELDGGIFCEIVYTILEGILAGTYADRPSKPKNMVDACKALEKHSPDANRVGDKSIRVLIPKVLLPLYEIRNNRGVGHAGGDVDPNFMDATAVYNMSSWVMAELIRILHAVTTEEAQGVVNSLVERKMPLVWEAGGIRRVLNPTMGKADQTLVLLYGSSVWTDENDLVKSVEYSSLGMYRKRVLEPLHNERKIEYDRVNRRALLSPVGSNDVEERILKSKIANL